MDIQVEKLKLIEWLVSLNDQSTIEHLKWLKENAATASDWWQGLSDAEKASIAKGLDDSKNGNVTPHEEVRRKYDKWL